MEPPVRLLGVVADLPAQRAGLIVVALAVSAVSLTYDQGPADPAAQAIGGFAQCVAGGVVRLSLLLQPLGELCGLSALNWGP